MEANSEDRVKAILDVFQSKLVKRGISLKALDAGEPQLSGKEYKIFASIEEGISQENAKKVAKIIRDEGPKGVKAQVQGDELRVSSKSRDDLQAVHRPAEGQGLRLRPAVRQLPLTAGAGRARSGAERPAAPPPPRPGGRRACGAGRRAADVGTRRVRQRRASGP